MPKPCSQEAFARAVLAVLGDPRVCVVAARKRKGKLVGELRLQERLGRSEKGT